MDAKLVVAKGKTAVREIPLAGINTIIGRRADCSLRIPSPLVSRQHCELTQAGTRLIVKDLGSSNGTFVNGAKIKQKELKSGDTLGVGPITFIVQLGGASVSPADTSRPHAAAAVASADGEDVADFVVAEDVATDDAMDFVAAEEVPAEEVVEAADFVVGEEVSAGAAEEVADFVVGEEAPAEAVEEVADFVVGEEAAPATEIDEVSDFVVSEVAGGAEEPDVISAEPSVLEAETVHDVNISEFIAEAQSRKSPAAKAVVQASAAEEAEAVFEAEAVVESDTTAESVTEAKEPKKKRGLFGGLFKKKDKTAARTEPPRSEATAKTKVAAAAPPPPIPSKPGESAAPTPEAEMPEFFVQDESGKAGSLKKPVGEDEMADFLMGLNEKDE